MHLCQFFIILVMLHQQMKLVYSKHIMIKRCKFYRSYRYIVHIVDYGCRTLGVSNLNHLQYSF